MAATHALGACGEIRVGSSPTLSTTLNLKRKQNEHSKQ